MRPKDQQKQRANVLSDLKAPPDRFSSLSHLNLVLSVFFLHVILNNTKRLVLCRCRFKTMKGKSVKKGRDWILEKKERRRRQGRCVHGYFKLSFVENSFNVWPCSWSFCFLFLGLQGRSSGHKIHWTSEKTSFLAVTQLLLWLPSLSCWLYGLNSTPLGYW